MIRAHPELTIIILSYNVRQLLVKGLNSLFTDPKSQHWQIIVVDNASTDDSLSFLKKAFKVGADPRVRPASSGQTHRSAPMGNQLTLIKSPTNLGFSAGNNLATPHIKAPYTLFLNPDTEVPLGTIPFVLNYLKKNPAVGAVTCKVLLANGQLDDGCHRGFPTPWNSFCHFSGLNKLFPQSKWFSGYWQGYKGFNTVHEIDALTGAFMMLPTKLGQKLNWWDEDYFFNGEDLDFCYRIKQTPISSAPASAREIPSENTYKIMYLPQVTITHYKGASGGYKSTSHGKNTASKETKIKTAKASTQAMRLFYQKHYLNKYPTLLTWLILNGISLLEKYRLSKII